MNTKRIIQLLFATFLLIAIQSCGEEKKSKRNTTQKKNPFKAKALYSVVEPKFQDSLVLNSNLSVELKKQDSTVKIDSFKVYFNYQHILTTTDWKFDIQATSEKVGINQLKIDAHLSNGKIDSKQTEVFLKSDTEPKALNYKLIKRYPHPENHFTQGLVYHDHQLYEGTGQWGRSALYKMDLETGKPQKELKLGPKIFGEGITIHKDKIYQLTYKSLKAYVYDLKTFNKLKEFTYPLYSEGWGIASDGTNLIMSNGTSRMYVLEEDGFSVLRQIDVSDHKGQVTMINELEVVDRLVYANLWLNNKIIQIDPKSGKVTGELDLTNLVPNEYKDEPSKVLNGIAYNPTNKHFYITGKDWKYLFEIEIY